MDIRQVIIARQKQLGWSNYRLTVELRGKVSVTAIYEFLRGETEMTTDKLGHVLEALGLGIPITGRK